MTSTFKKVVGTSAIGAISVLELINLQQASATPVNFNGSSVTYTPPANPGSAIAAIPVQVSITVDGASGTYVITGISTPVQPTGANAPYGSFAIPTLTSSALSAQSANVQSVSGATLLSVAWKSSLSAAINAAAAAGQSIGSSVPAPTSPTTPTPGATTPAAIIVPQNTTVTLGSPAIAASAGTPLSFSPIYLPAYQPPLGTSSLNKYLTEISNAISLLMMAQQSVPGGGTSIMNAIATLGALQSQVQGDIATTGSLPGVSSGFSDSLNTQLVAIATQVNLAISDYNAQVQAAIDKLTADSKAAALVALPAPTPTVTVTVTVTVTPTPKTAPVAGSPLVKSAGLINKSFTCIKTVGGKTTTKIVTGLIAKCPTGFTLQKK